MNERAEDGALGGLAGESLIETVDGPLAIGSLDGKSMPVLTRLADGALSFRLMTKIACRASGVAVLRVSFDNGQSVTVGRDHVFYARGMIERAAASLAAGEMLDTSFHFPAGYVFRRANGTTETSAGAVRVIAIEEAGTAEVFGGVVNETHRYFLTAGVLCRE